MAGTLFVVATPIGNLEDLSFRALRTLREVDLIAAEDTRRTAKLLAHYEIRRPVISLREHNERRETERLIARLTAGSSVALVSDAGTPAVADPGAHLVRSARQHGIRVVPIPGPSAVVTALSASGFPADAFTFLGFPPSSGAARQEWLDRLAAESSTVVFFEAPHRIARTLGEVTPLLVDRPIMIARELTKVHETLVEQHNITAHTDRERGEFTVVVGPQRSSPPRQLVEPAKALELFGRLTDVAGLEPDLALSLVGHSFGLTPAAARKLIKKAKISAKRQNDRPA